MKTTQKFYLLLFCSLLSNTFVSDAQTWIRPGAKWHYGYQGTYRTFLEMEYTGDTMMLGKQCQVIRKRYDYWYLQYPPPSTIFTHQGGFTDFYYTSVSGDSVFWYNNGAFHLLFDFGATAGDSWNVGVSTLDTNCDSSTVMVMATGTEVINGETLRWIELQPSSNAGIYFGGKYNERFGRYDAGLGEDALFPMASGCTGDLHFLWTRFICYGDDTFPTYNISDYEDCTSLRTLTVSAIDDGSAIEWYIDPIGEVLHYKPEKNTTIQIGIIDMQGRYLLLSSKDMAAGDWLQADVSGLKPGIYLLRVQSGPAVTNIKFLVTGE